MVVAAGVNAMSRGRAAVWAATGCAAALVLLFQYFGNSGRGYIDTSSLYYWWGYQWANPDSETEHGWLVLGLSGWLLWRNLRESDAGQRSEDDLGAAWPALVAMMAGLALHAVGFVAQQTRVSIVAFLLCAWGVLRLGGGRRWGAAAAFPLAFMVFAIPINALDSIGFWLRVWVVDASGAIARASGIAVLQSGTLLVAPDGKYNYDVAAACSGIRSLTAMAALSLLAGYLNFQTWRRRLLVLVLCFPLVYVGNVARILAIIFAAEAGGPKWGDIAHEVMGYGIFAIVLGGVLGAIALLRKFRPEQAHEVCHPLDDKSGCHLMDDKGVRARAEEEDEEEFGVRGLGIGVARNEVVVGGGNSGPLRRADERAARPYIVAGVVVALAVGEMVWLDALAQRPARGASGVLLAAAGKDPVELPAFLGIEWTGQPQPISAAELEILPPDTGYSRKLYFNHRDPSKQVFLSIVLSGRDRTSIHRPELCLVGQGWTIAESGTQRFTHPADAGAEFAATLLRVRREVQTPAGKQIVPQLVAYWFVASDAVEATHARMFFRDAWNRVTRGRADRWAYVLLQTSASDGEAAALARMQTVLDATLPVFQRPLATE